MFLWSISLVTLTFTLLAKVDDIAAEESVHFVVCVDTLEGMALALLRADEDAVRHCIE